MTAAVDSYAWVLAADEPWTRYRALIDIEKRSFADAEVMAARSKMVTSPPVINLLERAAGWPGYPLKRHNDAAHPLYAISTLADFGMDPQTPGLAISSRASWATSTGRVSSRCSGCPDSSRRRRTPSGGHGCSVMHRPCCMHFALEPHPFVKNV